MRDEEGAPCALTICTALSVLSLLVHKVPSRSKGLKVPSRSQGLKVPSRSKGIQVPSRSKGLNVPRSFECSSLVGGMQVTRSHATTDHTPTTALPCYH